MLKLTDKHEGQISRIEWIAIGLSLKQNNVSL